METTLVLIKPDAVRRGILGQILSRFEQEGLRIYELKMLNATTEQARFHYGEHEGKSFYDSLVTFLCSGPLVALMLEGEDVIARTRKLIGTTDPKNAAPGTIRRDFAGHDQTLPQNIVHSSDSWAAAQWEFKIWFPEVKV